MTDHPSLFDHGPAHRAGDHQTSIEAARKAVQRHGLRRDILRQHYVRGMFGISDWELQQAFDQEHPGSVVKRRTDLTQAGCIEATARTTTSPHGSRATVWQITGLGRRIYEEVIRG